jgi:hypothetical protein
LCKISNIFILCEFKSNNITDLRFDPIEGYPCSCKIIGIKSYNKDLRYNVINAEYNTQNEYVFIDIDPMIEIKDKFSTISYLEIEYVFQILEPNKVMQIYNKLKQKYNKLEVENEQNKMKLYSIYQSNGWKFLKGFYNLRDKFLS